MVSTPDVTVNAPQMPQQQPPVDQINMPQMAQAPAPNQGPVAPPSDPSGPPPAPIRTPPQPLPQAQAQSPYALPRRALDAAMPHLIQSLAYAPDGAMKIAGLLQQRDQMAAMDRYYAQGQNGAGAGPGAGSDNPAIRADYGNSVSPAEEAQRLSQLAVMGVDPKIIEQERQNYVALRQPTWGQDKSGRPIVTSGFHANMQPTVSEDGQTTMLPGAGGTSIAAATPGALGIKTNADIAGSIKPPVEGAMPAYDANQHMIGWMMPNGGFQTIQRSAAAKAMGEGSAKPYVINDPNGKSTLTSEAGAVGGGVAPAPGVPNVGGAGGGRAVMSPTQGDTLKNQLAQSSSDLAAFRAAGQLANRRLSHLQTMANLNPQIGQGGSLDPMSQQAQNFMQSVSGKNVNLSPRQQYQSELIQYFKDGNPDAVAGGGSSGTAANGGVAVRNLPEFKFVSAYLPGQDYTPTARAGMIQRDLRNTRVSAAVSQLAENFANHHDGNLNAVDPVTGKNFYQTASEYIARNQPHK